MQIVNLTPHPVVILRNDPEGEIVGYTGVGKAAAEGRFSVVAEFPPAGPVARAQQYDELVGELEIGGHQVPLIRTVFGSPTDLPEPDGKTLYVVSVITAQAARAAGRTTRDLLVTSDPVRDASGRYIGVRKLAVI